MATVALLSLSSNVFFESREEAGMKNDLIEARIFLPPLVLREEEEAVVLNSFLFLNMLEPTFSLWLFSDFKAEINKQFLKIGNYDRIL